jgi:hypothetical protein
VRGVGQVAISQVALTDGVTIRHAIDWTRKKTIGNPISSQGLPKLDGLTGAQILDVPQP